MYGADGVIAAGNNNYHFVKLKEVIPEIGMGLRYVNL